MALYVLIQKYFDRMYQTIPPIDFELNHAEDIDIGLPIFERLVPHHYAIAVYYLKT